MCKKDLKFKYESEYEYGRISEYHMSSELWKYIFVSTIMRGFYRKDCRIAITQLYECI